MTWLIIQTGSMVYELFEWLLTIVMSPEQADNYNGQQGDIWDAQKDMVLAMMGSTLMAVYYFVKNMFRQEE
jgi:putative membrane protein